MGAIQRVLALAACLALGGGCEAPSISGPAGMLTQGITDGEDDEEHDAVVALTTIFGGGTFCTGTVITPTVVLTAAHCLTSDDGTPATYENIVIAYGQNAYRPDMTSSVETGWSHPDFGTDGLNNDIGLLRLTEPAPVTPIPPSTDTMDVGAGVLVVGYGVTETEGRDGGLRRSGFAMVDWVSNGVLTLVPAPSNICFGDSGGPSITIDGAEKRVVGIHSYVRGDCGPRGFDQRVDIHMEEIRAFVLEEAPTCEDDHGCVRDCAEPDPDCDCGDDGLCSGTCPDGRRDPDCPDMCEADGICVDTCGTSDPDCPCSEDGRCDEACPEDPDCPEPAVHCSEDGFCDETCVDDLDCRLPFDAHGGGCSTAGADAGFPGVISGLLSLIVR